MSNQDAHDRIEEMAGAYGSMTNQQLVAKYADAWKEVLEFNPDAAEELGEDGRLLTELWNAMRHYADAAWNDTLPDDRR